MHIVCDLLHVYFVVNKFRLIFKIGFVSLLLGPLEQIDCLDTITTNLEDVGNYLTLVYKESQQTKTKVKHNHMCISWDIPGSRLLSIDTSSTQYEKLHTWSPDLIMALSWSYVSQLRNQCIMPIIAVMYQIYRPFHSLFILKANKT